MANQRRSISAAVSLMTLGALAAADELRVGEPYPDIRLPTVDGKETLSVSSFRGKKLLLVEFASW